MKYDKTIILRITEKQDDFLIKTGKATRRTKSNLLRKIIDEQINTSYPDGLIEMICNHIRDLKYQLYFFFKDRHKNHRKHHIIIELLVSKIRELEKLRSYLIYL